LAPAGVIPERASAILGISDIGRPVALFNCRRLRVRGTAPSWSGDYGASYCLLGFRCASESEEVISKFRLRLGLIDLWLRRPPFTVAGENTASGSQWLVGFDRGPDQRLGSDSSGNSVTVLRSPPRISNDRIRSVNFACDTSLQVECGSPVSLLSAVRTANQLRRFFSLLTGFPLAPPAIEMDRPPRATARPTGPYAFPGPELHYLPDFPVAPAGWRIGEILLNASHVGDSPGALLDNYLNTEEALRPAVDALLVTLSNPDLPAEVECLLLTQGLEVLHRVTSDETHLPRRDFKKLLRQLRKLNLSDQGILLTKDTRDRLCLSLQWANGLTLRERLTSLLRRLDDGLVSAVVPDVSGFVSAAVDTRNHLAHRGDPKHLVCTGRELTLLNLRMKILVLTLLLQGIGVNANLLAKRMPQSALFVELVQANYAH